MDINTKLFDDKSLADLFSEIHQNTAAKRTQINTYLGKMVQLVKTPDDAVVIGPVIQGFLDTNVKNDEHLIKIAQILQKFMILGAKSKESLEGLLTEEEKQSLLKGISYDLESMKADMEVEVEEPKLLKE